MQEKRDKGLCYNCDEKYHIGHKCNRPKLFLLEGVEIEGEHEEVEEELRAKYPILGANSFEERGSCYGPD